MLHFFMFLVNQSSHLKNIVMYYLVSGHTYLPNDIDFSFISREQKKRTAIYTPEDWMDLVRGCRKQKAFIVRDMTGKFLDFENLSVYFKDYQTVFKEGAKISRMRKIKFSTGSSLMHFNNDYGENYEVIDLKPDDVDSNTFWENIRNFVPIQARTSKPISYQKMKDIKKILKFVPPVHHPFYLSLPHIPRRGRNEEVERDEEMLPAEYGDD